MALVPHYGTYTDTAGNTIVGATVTVTDSLTGAASDLYTDVDGLVPVLGNVVLTNDSGTYSFYAYPGRYTLTITASGYEAVVRNEILVDPDALVVSIRNFLTPAQIEDVEAGTMLVDVTAAYYLARDFALEFYADVDAATIQFPVGRYLITDNNFLGNWTAASLPGAPAFKLGLRHVGAGWGSQIVWRPTSSTDVWMYDNGTTGATDNSLVMPSFHNLMFRCEITNLTSTAKLNGFREYGYSSGPTNRPTQGFMFDHCRFLLVDRGSTDAQIARAGTFMRVDGNVNASENKWINSKLVGWGTVLDLGPNVEAVNHEFHGTDCELIYGDVFKRAGGGSIRVFGGSWTMTSQALSYFLALRPTTAALAGTCSFSGGRLELNQNLHAPFNDYSMLLLTDASGQISAYNSSLPVINFNDWNSYPVVGAARDTIKIDAALPAKITFNGAALSNSYDSAMQDHQVLVVTSNATLSTDSSGPFAELTFNHGNGVPFDNVVFGAATAHAVVRARGCNNTLDYDLTAFHFGAYVKGINRPLKVASIFGRAWPDTGGNSTMSIRLPKGALLKKTMFRKAANAGDATAGYQLAMVDGAANAYCSSTIAAQNVEHKALADDLNIVLDDDIGYAAGISALQDIYLIATSGHLGSAQAVAMAATDYAVVEYY